MEAPLKCGHGRQTPQIGRGASSVPPVAFRFPSSHHLCSGPAPAVWVRGSFVSSAVSNRIVITLHYITVNPHDCSNINSETHIDSFVSPQTASSINLHHVLHTRPSQSLERRPRLLLITSPLSCAYATHRPSCRPARAYTHLHRSRNGSLCIGSQHWLKGRERTKAYQLVQSRKLHRRPSKRLSPEPAKGVRRPLSFRQSRKSWPGLGRFADI